MMFKEGDRVRVDMPGCKRSHHPVGTVVRDQVEGDQVVIRCDGYQFEHTFTDAHLVRKEDTA